MKKICYVLIGGFLGAGKTTALLRLAGYLEKKGLRAALITNDQSTGLVDTSRGLAAGHAVAEVTGGCFCCKFDHLMQAAQELTCGGEIDALVAEPVGSCTDIRATVGYPLRQLFGESCGVAPLSVLVDPYRAAEALNLDAGTRLTEKVVYIYRKQLEEADLIVINKVDLLRTDVRASLSSELRKDFPSARILEVSCHTGEGLDAWFDLLLAGSLAARPPVEVDYDVYAECEALLGWLNARASFTAEPAVLADDLMRSVLLRLKKQLTAHDVEIAHAKISIESGRPADFGSMSLTSTAAEPQAVWSSEARLIKGHLLLNLRAEADPDLLRNETMAALFTLPGVAMRVEELSAFRPGRPVPTHRLTALSAAC